MSLPVDTLPVGGVDAVIIGGGPAGYTAGIFLGRALARTLLLEGTAAGGPLQETGVVENFPGFPHGIDGPELIARMREQAQRAGTTIVALDATRLRLTGQAGERHEIITAQGSVRTRVVVLATGSTPRHLDLPGAAELGAGRGVAHCAVCEAPLYAGRDVAVIGGGDSAMEEALALSRYANRVYVIHRRDRFRCTPVLLERVRARPNVELRTSTVVTALHADPTGRLARVALRSAGDDAAQTLTVQAVFVAIGHTPRSELVANILTLTPTGHLHVTGPGGATARPGVFVAGDVADDLFRQAITAAGAGCAAALAAARYLEERTAAT